MEIGAAQRLQLLLQRGQKALQIKRWGSGALQLPRQRPSLAMATELVEQFHGVKSGHPPQLAGEATLRQGQQGRHGRFRVGGGAKSGFKEPPLRRCRPARLAAQQLGQSRSIPGVMAGIGQKGAGHGADGVLALGQGLEQRQSLIQLTQMKAHISLDQAKPRRAPQG